MLNKIFIIMTILLLTSCSVFSPVKTETVNSYELKKIPAVSTKKTPHRVTLIVTPTEASPIYDTTQMAYTSQTYEVSYFSKNHWAASPAEMLQNLIIQTLENTHYFHAISTPTSTGHYDYILNTQLLQLEQDFSQNPSVERLKVRAQLIRAGTSNIIATKEFSVAIPAPQNTPYSGVVAANQATAHMLKELSEFCLRSIRK